MIAKTGVVSLAVTALTMAAIPAYADSHQSELISQSASVTEAVADSISLDLGTLAEELTAEIAEAISAGVIASETVEIVLAAVDAGNPDEVSSVLEAQTAANSEQWSAESEVWLTAESEVVESGVEECAADDSSCRVAVASTVTALVSERLMSQIQARISEVLALPEEERNDELEEMSEAVQELRERLSLLARQPDPGDDSPLDGRRLDAENNFRAIDEDIAEELAEIVTGDDDILDDWFDDDDSFEREDDDDVDDSRDESGEDDAEDREDNREESSVSEEESTGDVDGDIDGDSDDEDGDDEDGDDGDSDDDDGDDDEDD